MTPRARTTTSTSTTRTSAPSPCTDFPFPEKRFLNRLLFGKRFSASSATFSLHMPCADARADAESELTKCRAICGGRPAMAVGEIARTTGLTPVARMPLTRPEPDSPRWLQLGGDDRTTRFLNLTSDL